MGAVSSAPGVINTATRIFITQDDVSALLGCGKSKAYQIVREVNNYAKQQGNHSFPAGKANKYLFSSIYNIPIEDVDKVISSK